MDCSNQDAKQVGPHGLRQRIRYLLRFTPTEESLAKVEDALTAALEQYDGEQIGRELSKSLIDASDAGDRFLRHGRFYDTFRPAMRDYL